MSGLVVGTVLKFSRARGNARMVLVVIADSCKDDGTGAWPSVNTIAARAGVSESTAHRCLSELVRKRELVIEQNAGPYNANLYSIPIDGMGGVKLTPVSNPASGGVKSSNKGVSAVTPDPSSGSVLDPSIQGNPFVKPKYAAGQFESFWSLYPKKTEKKDAQRAWLKVPAAEFPKLMTRLKQFIAVDWLGREKALIPNPATWLNGERWNDEIIPPARYTNGNGHHPPEQDTPLYHQPFDRKKYDYENQER